MKKLLFSTTLLVLLMAFGCSQKASEDQSNNTVDFTNNQPLESGTYEASYFDITGPNARKGHFDGRILVSLSPDISALYIYENGNHTKIDYLVMLDKPFEKGDSGVYKAIDKEGKPVIIREDSVTTLSFDKKENNITIEFDKTPKSVQSAFDVLQRINDLRAK